MCDTCKDTGKITLLSSYFSEGHSYLYEDQCDCPDCTHPLRLPNNELPISTYGDSYR